MRKYDNEKTVEKEKLINLITLKCEYEVDDHISLVLSLGFISLGELLTRYV